MKKLAFLIVSCLFMIVVPFFSCTTHAEQNEQSEKINQIDHFIQTQMKAAHIPGLAIGIVKGDQIVYLKGYGNEVSPQTPFILGSTTKSFTAMAVMQLVEEGKVDLDSPIQAYLPAIDTPKITVRQLLNQNSGISSSEKMQINQENIGREFQYSNQNYKLLGQIITSASKIPYEEYIRKNIFSPLDMAHSYTSQTTAKENGLAAGHRTWFGINLPNELPFNDDYLSAGFLISSAEDMTHYLIAQMNNGQYSNVTVLSGSSVKEMHTPSVKAPIMGEDSYYGMGWFIRPINGVPTIMHSGEVPNYHSTMIMMPDENYGIILLANINNSILISGLIEKIGSGVVDLLAEKEPESIPKSAYYQAYLMIDGVILIIIVLLFFHIKNISTWHFKLVKGELGILKKFIYPLSINFLIPLLILTQLPGSLGFTWSFLYDFIPDITSAVWFIAIVLLTGGCIKLFLGALFYKTNSSLSSNI
ncbi:serine hydrolase [Bacillus sp. S/N-304-OC-R1]|uniref:serine hydrolase domain-containing protein n=1 Tax=Bacillus sp. S/N-304-OC-R1 TaxID=2758034 RepID=UPI001C8D24CA|nr:serine hydrolase domain-containing protein [Bacillus sp. S/N-304-OC-R1]MBY0123538.1 beta-lactamase family protein [Bacillus sp. S/N-304-OC-R1]